MIFRKPLLSLLIFSIILAQLGDGIILVGYQLNKKYISQTLCENQLSKISVCNGSCYLKKEIKKNHQKQANANTKSQQVIAILDNSLKFQACFLLISENNFTDRVSEILIRPTLIGFRPPANCI